MAVITTGNFAKALWPGVNAWYGKAYAEHKTEWTELFETYNSGKKYEEDVGYSGFGLIPEKPEGQGIQYDTEKQGFVTRYVHTAFGGGFIVTKEMFDDDLYAVVGEKRAKALAFSVNQTRENNAAFVYNNAFSSSYLGGDGKALLASDHPRVAGGTFSNILTVAADLSEAALEQATIDLMKFENDRGLKIRIMPKSLHIAPDNVYEAMRILKSPLQSDSAGNNINALAAAGVFPGGVKVNHYFSDADAWFIRTDCPDGMKHFERASPEFTMDNDFDTENAKFKVYFREAWGWTDPRCLFGSAGA
jgi:hypothetical protein